MAEAEDDMWSSDEEAKDGRQVAASQWGEAVGSLEPSVSAALGFKDMLEAALRAPEEPSEAPPPPPRPPLRWQETGGGSSARRRNK